MSPEIPSTPARRIEVVREYLQSLQMRIVEALETADGGGTFAHDPEQSERGLSAPRVLAEGALFEKAAVNFTASSGDALPPAATAQRPELAGRGFQAASLSLIVHPRNPYVPTTHANFRFFQAVRDDADPVWWFGGGFDLTPYYGFEEDAVYWHRCAREACAPFGADVYPRYKKWCDEYFYLPHRNEARGVGGLFFDDVNDGGFERSFAFVQAIGDAFLPAYLPIVERRRKTPFGERERSFQLHRRGRYVEFNLIYDRGTLYGLQSGRRIETVLASMPPLVAWSYKWPVEEGSREAELTEQFLAGRDWLAE